MVYRARVCVKTYIQTYNKPNNGLYIEIIYLSCDGKVNQQFVFCCQ